MTALRTRLLIATLGLTHVVMPVAVQAQTVGSATTGTGGTTSGGTTAGGSSAGGTSSFGGTGTSAFLPPAPPITGAARIGVAGSGRSVLNSSNAFGTFYANPYYAGRAGALVGALPGGFGQQLYTTTTTGSSSSSFNPSSGSSTPGGSNAFSAAATGGAGSSATGFGGNSGQGTMGATGFGGTSAFGGNQQQLGGTNRNQQQGQFGAVGQTGRTNQSTAQVIPQPRPIAYTQTLNFATPRPTAPQVAADLRGVLDRSSMLQNSRLIDLYTDGQVVVLRGTVASEDEARTAEGMIRLTPGVREVRNELTVASAVVPVPAPVPAP